MTLTIDLDLDMSKVTSFESYTCVKVPSVTGRVARRVVACRTDARRVFRTEFCSILWSRMLRQSRASMCDQTIRPMSHLQLNWRCDIGLIVWSVVTHRPTVLH